MRTGDVQPVPGRPAGQLRMGTTGRPRREVLRLGAVAALVSAGVAAAGCDPFNRETQPPPPDPLAPLVDDALALAARYEAAIAAHPQLTARLNTIATTHRTHASELARALGITATPGTSPGASPATAASSADGAGRGVLAELRTLEQQGRDRAAKACADAPAHRAALIGSIAAARATHLEALR